jgi:putative membrane protein (TIGR04086 family)
MRLKANIAVFGCALALICAVAVVLTVNFTSHPDESLPNLGFIALLWLVAFFVPAFITGSRAPNAGALFGLVVGPVPLLVAVFFGYGVPWPFALFFTPSPSLVGSWVSDSVMRPVAANVSLRGRLAGGVGAPSTRRWLA